MSDIAIEKFSIVFRDNEGIKHILLDGDNTVRNVSRIPLQIFDNNVTWAEKLVEIQEKFELLSRGTEEHNIGAFLINCLLANYLVEKVGPAKVIEFGCSSGLLSWNLIQLLHVFHEDSSLCCVTDVIGNCSNDTWLARVNDSVNLIHMTLLVSEYDKIMLAQDSFDAVVINGNLGEQLTSSVLRQGLHLLSQQGIMICLINRQAERFIEMMDGITKKYERIMMDDNRAILVFRKKDIVEEISDFDIKVKCVNEAFNDFMKKDTGGCEERHMIDSLIDLLNDAICTAISEQQVEQKVKFIEMRRVLLERFVSISSD